VINRRDALGFLAAASILPSRSFANVAPPRSEIREDLAKHFADAGTVGTFVGYKTDDYVVIASDKDRSGEAMLPASTFKIPNSVIALETGVVGDPDQDVFKWDGVARSIEAWNRDHTLRTAIAASVVPVYQEIARRIGAERMQKYLDLFEYGNRDIGGGIDQFWLTGKLRIDPVQQIDFVDRLSRSEARNWCVISCRSRNQAIPSFVPKPGYWVQKSASRRWAGWWAGPRRAARVRYLRSTSTCASRGTLPIA
jgi:beta-lactamase class D